MKDLKFIMLFCFLGSSLVFAQWDKYPTYEAYLDIMSKFESDYPGLCRIVEFGQSVKGRKLLCAKISDNIGVKEAEPGFMYSSTIHGDETAGFILMLHLIDSLLSGYGIDPFVTRLVDSVDIWINPVFNPDGLYDNRPYGGNANNVDLDRNFPNPLKGPHPDGKEWQPETKAMMALADSVAFVMSANFHGGAEVVAYPFSTWTTGEHPHVDMEWWKLVCNEYVDTAHTYSPSGYMNGPWGPVTNSGDWYIIYGGRMDYMNYFAHCREVKIELSNQKLLPEPQLPDHWSYNYRSFLHYIEQVLYGIRGTVKDSITGEPIEAKVFIEDYDIDSSFIRSHLPHGDYYRPLYAGTYDITFSAPGYISKTFMGVIVRNGEATELDVKLTDLYPGIIYSGNNFLSKISFNTSNGCMKITYSTGQNTDLRISVFNLSGRLMKGLNVQKGPGTHTVTWNGVDNNNKPVSDGCYIVQLQVGDKKYCQSFMFLR